MKDDDLHPDNQRIVRAVSRAELYEKAALAMFDILVDLERVRGEGKVSLEVSGEDREDLMVRWLSALLCLHQTRRLLLCRFEVRSIDDTHLFAVASGEPLDPARHIVRTELKAVTDQHILVSEDREGWSGRIIFDL